MAGKQEKRECGILRKNFNKRYKQSIEKEQGYEKAAGSLYLHSIF